MSAEIVAGNITNFEFTFVYLAVEARSLVYGFIPFRLPTAGYLG